MLLVWKEVIIVREISTIVLFAKIEKKIQFNVFVNVKNAFVAAFRWQICLFVTRNVVLFPLNE